MTTLLDTLKSLETAEDFLNHFGVAYDQRVVDVNRLHILQRLHDRLSGADLEAMDEPALQETMPDYLARAYSDFVASDARTEKVFTVFHRAGASAKTVRQTMIPLTAVRGTGQHGIEPSGA